MKTLKITLTLIAVALLTVSGVQSENAAVNEDQPTYKTHTTYDLVAHNKNKVKIKSQG